MNTRTEQDKARQEVEEYLANYGNSHSTHMDSKFHLFKSDVASLAKDVEHGDAYIYLQLSN
ncbi:hypothetical protein ACRCJS_09185 [Aerococcus urinaeequi]|uniref:hypothetical protein n=1 Tax=Aerococcus urinaeequi TaxID=51665 RepID=UPI003AAFCDE9